MEAEANKDDWGWKSRKAREIDISAAYVTHLARGRCRVGAEVLPKLMAYWNIKSLGQLEQLATEYKSKSRTESHEPYPLRGELCALSAFKSAPDAVQKYIRSIRLSSGDYARIEDWIDELRSAERRYARGEIK